MTSEAIFFFYTLFFSYTFMNSRCHSPLHIHPQENISEKEEGNEQRHSLQSISNLSAPGWQGEVHNHQHKVHYDQYDSEYTRRKKDSIINYLPAKEMTFSGNKHSGHVSKSSHSPESKGHNKRRYLFTDVAAKQERMYSNDCSLACFLFKTSIRVSVCINLLIHCVW